MANFDGQILLSASENEETKQTGSCPPGWRNSWLLQISDSTLFGIRAEWTRARRRGHTRTGLTQQTSAVYAI